MLRLLLVEVDGSHPTAGTLSGHTFRVVADVVADEEGMQEVKDIVSGSTQTQIEVEESSAVKYKDATTTKSRTNYNPSHGIPLLTSISRET